MSPCLPIARRPQARRRRARPTLRPIRCRRPGRRSTDGARCSYRPGWPPMDVHRAARIPIEQRCRTPVELGRVPGRQGATDADRSDWRGPGGGSECAAPTGEGDVPIASVRAEGDGQTIEEDRERFGNSLVASAEDFWIAKDCASAEEVDDAISIAGHCVWGSLFG